MKGLPNLGLISTATRASISGTSTCEDIAMSLSGFSRQMISDVLVIGLYWAVAWGISWLTGSDIVFYLIGALATIVGLGAIIDEIRSQLDEILTPYP
jgi:hypothetical protein